MELGRALKSLPNQAMPEILVGFDSWDDAGVLRVSDDLALVQTIDFFAPIVDDPFIYGQIAAANALSDVYAMGGQPISAVAVLGFPCKVVEPEIIKDIMAGGLDKLNEAKVALLGGHTVNDDELKFGYAVTGTVNPHKICQNNSASTGDHVLLTKPLGTGLVAQALKRGQADPSNVEIASRVMAETNQRAAELVSKFSVSTMTDVTGFGLLGHSIGVARASNVTIELDHARIPLLSGALEYSEQGFCSGGLQNNRDFFESDIKWNKEISEARKNIFFDPQTSGGLLVFAPEEESDELAAELAASQLSAFKVGRVRAPGKALITVS